MLGRNWRKRIFAHANGISDVPTTSRGNIAEKNSIVTEVTHMGLIPIICAKVMAGGKPGEETPLNRCGVGRHTRR